MSQTDKDADLSNAIRELEALLDGQSDNGEQLPVLDEIVGSNDTANAGDIDTREASATGTTSSDMPQPDPVRIRALLDRIAIQMDTELKNVSGMLKDSLIKKFRNELAVALDMEPQQLDAHISKQDDEPS